jgi:hypothetical protein
MGETDIPLQKVTQNIKILTSLDSYPVWSKRVSAAFTTSQQWDTPTNKPKDNATTNAIMLNLVDDIFVQQLLDGDCTASTIWNHITGLYHVSDLSTQISALTALTGYTSDCPTMLHNKTKLLDF